MRTFLLTVLIVAGLPLAARASAAPAECQGRTATITSDGGTVNGTEGDDVISTTGVVNIFALGGNDIVCLVLGSVHAGTGDDSVQLTVANGSTAGVDGGDGTDTLSLLGPDTDTAGWEVDLAGAVRRSGAPVATLAGLEEHSLDFGRLVPLAVHGTAGPDLVEIVSGDFDAALLGGDDRLEISGHDLTGAIDGGDGTDAVWSFDAARIIIILGKRGIVVMGGETFGLDRFEDATASAYRVEVRGSRKVNTLDLTGCIVHGYGEGGDDLLSLGAVGDLTCPGRRNTKLYGDGGDDRLEGSRLRDVLTGGPGNDQLAGLRGRDTLLGEAGRDKADGGGGRDTCEAEVMVKCEVKA